MSAAVTVFCGSSRGVGEQYAAAAHETGAELARRGIELVYGGGSVGLMGVLADAALAGGGRVTGVIPQHLADQEIAHLELTELVVTGSMHKRKARMIGGSSGFVVLPGGFGTFEEALEVVTWNQLGLVTANVVCFDVDGFFAPLTALVDGAVSAGFIRPEHAHLVHVVDSASAAIDLALARPRPFVPKWADR
jgi:uncharacterized protein (TIGR00730 family)